MAFPGIFRRLFANSGAGPMLRADIIPVRYELGEFYFFRHPDLRAGFAPLTGGLISNCATAYPEIWAYLATTAGAKLCCTEAQWQAMSTATWATLADGTTVGWEGIGGVPFYVRNTSTGNLRLPDLRGMYAEAAGFDSLGVGGVDGDRGRNAAGAFHATALGYNYPKFNPSGAFTRETVTNSAGVPGDSDKNEFFKFVLNLSRVQPTGSTFAPRRWGALACCWLGTPAS